MESRAQNALIGLIVVALTASFLGFIFWYSSGRAVPKAEVQIVFQDKVSGLGRGSGVLFNGLNVGEVTRIELRSNDPQRIYAVVKVDPATPIRTDTRARIEAQGFAGVVAVQILGGDPGSPALTAQTGQTLPTIYAEPSESILETVRTVAKRTDEAINGLEALIEANAGTINATVKNAEAFSARLSGSTDDIDRLMKGAGSLADFIAPMTTKVGSFTEQMTETVQSFDRRRVTSIIDDADKVAAALGNGEVREAVKNATSTVERLNRASDVVEEVLIAAQHFLYKAAGQDGHSIFETVAEAARSLRVLADNLNEQVAEFAANISRLADGGLRSIENLTTTGRGALTGVSRSLREVERNPQGLIFGTKKSLPQYNGAR